MRSLNWYCWGEALRVLGDPEAAITKFRRLYEQEFPSPECVTAWARALIDLGRNEEALAKFAEAEQLDHENARNYLRWGEALQSRPQNDGDVMIAKAHALAPNRDWCCRAARHSALLAPALQAGMYNCRLFATKTALCASPAISLPP
jgi:tetratricopeptide (TPR) repeat protein